MEWETTDHSLTDLMDSIIHQAWRAFWVTADRLRMEADKFRIVFWFAD
jgi:hypothetical protein